MTVKNQGQPTIRLTPDGWQTPDRSGNGGGNCVNVLRVTTATAREMQAAYAMHA